MWGHLCLTIPRTLCPPGIYILIAVGAVMMFVGFLGCYGAIQESQCLLGTVRAGQGVADRVRLAEGVGAGHRDGLTLPVAPEAERPEHGKGGRLRHSPLPQGSCIRVGG